jgi:hypothetical protein
MITTMMQARTAVSFQKSKAWEMILNAELMATFRTP